MIGETAGEDELAKRIFDSWRAYREQAIARATYAENGCVNDRALAS